MLRAVGSAGLLEDVSVAAPVRTCTDGHSKSGGRLKAADALALPAEAPPRTDAFDHQSGNEDEEQPASIGPSRANAVVRPRHGKRNSDTPTPRTPQRNPPRLRSGMANSR